MRKKSPEMDPLRLGTGWSKEDLSKPQIFIESTFGDSHPGSALMPAMSNELLDYAYRSGLLTMRLV